MKISIQLLLGLFEMHFKKILHRNLKPNNVFVDSSDNLKIGDFGCGKILESLEEKRNTMMGTPMYLSPEVIEEMPFYMIISVMFGLWE